MEIRLQVTKEDLLRVKELLDNQPIPKRMIIPQDYYKKYFHRVINRLPRKTKKKLKIKYGLSY